MILNYNEYINEGLIHTYPIAIYKNSLIDELDMIGIEYKLNINDAIFNIELKKIDILDIYKINSVCNNLGYFITKYKIFKNGKSNIIKYKSTIFCDDVKDNDGVILYYEAKFDDIIKVNDLVYHATELKHFEKILNIGLCPRSSSRLEYHYERIYLFENLESTINIIPRLRSFGDMNSDYIIMKIDLKNIKCYKDSKSSGFYIYDNINPDDITFLNKIYTLDGIIEFDNYKINKKSIDFYNNSVIIYQFLKNKNY
jgi:hypothetical protein